MNFLELCVTCTTVDKSADRLALVKDSVDIKYWDGKFKES